MNPLREAGTNDRTDDVASTPVRRRRFLALGLGAGATLLAGCSGDGSTSVPTGDDGDESGGDTGGDQTDASATATEPASGGDVGTFRLLISDRPNAIDDFDSLEVSFDHARVFRSGDGEESTSTPVPTDATETAVPTDATATPAATGTAENATATEGEAITPTATATPANGTAAATTTAEPTPTSAGTEGPEGGDEESEGDGGDDEGSDDGADGGSDGGGGGEAGGFTTIDLGGATVDLTEVVGEKATGIFEGGLAAGRYTKVELHAAEVRGVVDGEPADVKLPSGKLMITKPFEVEAGSTVSFVFDISVVKKGNGGYNLLPVVSESGVAGEDVDVEEVDDRSGGTDDGEREATAAGDGRGDGEQAGGGDGNGNHGNGGNGNGDGGSGGEGDSGTPTPEETSTPAE